MSLTDLAEAEWGPSEWPDGWPETSLQCSIGQYILVASSEGQVEHAMLFHQGDTLFVRQSGASAIFEDGRVILDAVDVDSDGAFDQMSYSAYESDGWDEVLTRDFGIDGQPDTRQYRRDTEVQYWRWIEGGWYQADNPGSLVVDHHGTMRSYVRKGDRFVFSEEQP